MTNSYDENQVPRGGRISLLAPEPYNRPQILDLSEMRILRLATADLLQIKVVSRGARAM
jgi:hypothetical protein